MVDSNASANRTLQVKQYFDDVQSAAPSLSLSQDVGVSEDATSVTPTPAIIAVSVSWTTTRDSCASAKSPSAGACASKERTAKMTLQSDIGRGTDWVLFIAHINDLYRRGTDSVPGEHRQKVLRAE